MTLFEQILCGGVVLAAGCGVLAMGSQANAQVDKQTQMFQAMTVAEQQAPMLEAMAKAEAERRAKLAEENRKLQQ